MCLALQIGAGCEESAGNEDAGAAPDAHDGADSSPDATPPLGPDAAHSPDAAPAPDAANAPDAAAAPDAAPAPDATPPPPDADPPDADPPDADPPDADPPDADPPDAEPPPDADPLSDADGDGFPYAEDCDDHDAHRHPGALELSDGHDDDCDGIVDELVVCADGVAPYATLQGAIYSAADGAVIEVCAGVYTENLFLERPLTLRATDGPEVTVIDGSGIDAVVRLWSVPAPGVTIDGFTIRNGIATTRYGGGVRCELSTLTLTGSVIRDNQSTGAGGLLAEDCDIDVRGNRFEDNLVATRGGGVALIECTGGFVGNTVSGNSAEEGGGLAVVGGSAIIEDNDIADNVATKRGGGIHHQSNAPIRGNRVDRNACDFKGGGIYVVELPAELSDNDVRDNTAVDDGGGIFIQESNAQVIGNRISGNSTSDDGGGMRVLLSSIVMSNNVLTGNYAWADGGGIKISHAASLVTDNLFEGNEAGNVGGAIELDDDTSTVRRCIVRDNVAWRGGGIHGALISYPYRIESSVIVGNTGYASGGGIELKTNSGGGTFEFLVLAGNESPAGAAIRVENAPITLSSSIVVDHVAGTLIEVTGVMAAPSVQYTDIYPPGAFSGMADPTGTGGNISATPMFVAPGSDDYRLQPGSPCIDAGDPAMVDSDDTRADMGAYAGPEAMP